MKNLLKKTPPELVIAALLTLMVVLLLSSCRARKTDYIRGDSTVTYTPGVVITPPDTGEGWFDAVAFCDSLVKWRRDTLYLPGEIIKIPVMMASGRGAAASIAVQQDGMAKLTVNLDSLQQIIDSLNKEVVRVDTLKTTIYKCDSGFHRFTVWWFIGTILLLLGGLLLKRF